MTKADKTTTTARQRLLGEAATREGVPDITILPAAAVSAPFTPPHCSSLDAELMHAIDRFRGCHAEVLALEARTDHTWSEVEKAGAEWDDAAEALCDIPPVTQAGLAAKAAALGTVLHACVGDFTRPQDFEEKAEAHERLAMTLVLDVLRLTGGVA